jgi:RNA polymerase sigma-70 factor (ECF subfamily)
MGVAGEEFDGFYAASYRRLLKQLVAVTGDLAEAEDALQEAYARASVRWQRLVAYDSPEAWVRRVAMNVAVSAARRARRRAIALGRLAPQPAVPELTPDALDLAAALRSIPLGQRQAVVLHHLVGLPVGEIARELGLPAGTVKARLARGRAALARRLALDPEEMLTRE